MMWINAPKVYKYSKIRYVYFIYIKRRLVYIGRSSNPLKRIMHHEVIPYFSNCKAVIYGPYYDLFANELEAQEIKRRKPSKYLISQTTHTKKSFHDKISVKDYGQKTIRIIAKAGKSAKVVSQYAN